MQVASTRPDARRRLSSISTPVFRQVSRFRHLIVLTRVADCPECRRYNTRRGSMPSFFILEIRVVRGIPKRCAAPVAPATRPFVAFRSRRMSSRSPASRVPFRGTTLAPWVSSSNGTWSAEPRVKMTERSIIFSSSRMFPGQLQAASFSSLGREWSGCPCSSGGRISA